MRCKYYCGVLKYYCAHNIHAVRIGKNEREMMPLSRLDPIDRRILAELQADGRITNVELASRVGISAPPCLRRVRALEEQGFVRGYHADVDSRQLGFEVSVFVMVGLQSQAEADLREFENRCIAWPLVRECHMLNGATSGKYMFDLPRFGLSCLRASGIHNCEWVGECTYSSPEKYYSYRRTTHKGEADYGRLISVIRL